MSVQNLTPTNHIHTLAEGGNQILELKNNSYNKGLLYLDTTEDSDDGTWLRVSDYKRFCNKVNDGDTEAIQNFLIGGKRKKCDYGEFVMEKKGYDEIIVTFKSPIKALFGYVGEEQIVKDVTKLEGRIHWDFFFRRNGRQEEIANGIEFYLEDAKFLG